MQTKYQIPGVYFEDVFATPAPELLTGVPAFLGMTGTTDEGKNIPVNTPQMLTLWPQFEQYFGQPLPQPQPSYLAYAVRGFFENGGRLCYVMRLKDSTPEALEEGLAALTALDTIDLVCAPNLMVSPAQMQIMQKAILEHCEQMGDRFAILDAGNVKQVNEIQQLSSDNGAMYFPWLKVKRFKNDPETELLEVPPCGHIAGIYARSDQSGGIHQSPANYILEGVLDLSLDLSNADIEILNPEQAIAGVNCLRILPGRGIRVWGTHSLSQNPEWRYINVRRLFLTVGRWVERNLANVAFEPNNFRLWVRIERELTGYFEALFQQGALKGRIPQEAFYIKCNAETNPPEVQDAGMVVTEIGLAPTIPNEFIIVRLIHGTTGVTLTEST